MNLSIRNIELHEDRSIKKKKRRKALLIILGLIMIWGMPDAEMELSYEGAKEMILVDDVDNREFLRELVEAMYEDLPAPKKK